jgi:hypothetical protein
MTTPIAKSPVLAGSVLESDPSALLAPLDTFARRHLGPTGIDLASGVESSPGIKDREKVESLIAAVRRAEMTS